jgi:hypothetical protein
VVVQSVLDLSAAVPLCVGRFWKGRGVRVFYRLRLFCGRTSHSRSLRLALHPSPDVLDVHKRCRISDLVMLVQCLRDMVSVCAWLSAFLSHSVRGCYRLVATHSWPSVGFSRSPSPAMRPCDLMGRRLRMGNLCGLPADPQSTGCFSRPLQQLRR